MGLGAEENAGSEHLAVGEGRAVFLSRQAEHFQSLGRWKSESLHLNAGSLSRKMLKLLTQT